MRVAVVSGAESLTYGELDSRATRLAHYLRGCGVGAESVVGLCVPRTADMVVAALAVWKAGGAYLPLDPGHPVQRLAFMLSDSRVPVVVGHAEALDELPVGGRRMVALDDPAVAAAVASAPDTALEVHGGLDRLGYVIYTSGSTGRPKGVHVTQRGLLNYLTWAVQAYRPVEERGAPVHSSLGFDLTVTSLFVPLLSGAPVVLVEESLQGLADAVTDRGGFDLIKLTPGHLRLLRDLLPVEQRAGTARRLVVGGEALSGALTEAWLRDAPDTVIVNEYGPTETVVGCCVLEVAAGDEVGESVAIGRPIANTRLYALDEAMRPVPVGVAGELFIGGSGVARGYGGRPELTAERFLADPFAGDGSRLYRSGDLVRWRADGELEFLGRADEQVKVRGYRIEPAEIEAALCLHPAVAAAAVVADGDEAARRLVAYLVPTDPAEGAPAAGDLREHLRDRLPDYMIPAVFVELTAVPLTTNGKVDRAALPTPGGLVAPRTRAEAPRTPEEELLAEIWREVLGAEAIGVHDDFFDLGGNSLLVVQVVAHVRANDYDISLSDFFEAPTVAGMASRIRGRVDVKKTEDRSAVEIRSGTTSPVMFIVHSSSGGITEFTELAGHFADDQRVYGLQSRGMRDGTPLETIEEMAAAYVSEVIGVQPAGPYLLAGWSMGGYVVVEMARLLQKMGREVGGVFLIGPPYHQPRDRSKTDAHQQMMRGLAFRLTEAIDDDAGTTLEKQYEETLLSFWDQDDDGVAAIRSGDKDRMRAGRVGVLNSMAVLTYRVARFRRSYRGRVVLFMPQKDDDELQQLTLKQWRKALRGKAEVVKVPGTHRKIINEQGAAAIGAWLSAEITRWESTGAV